MKILIVFTADILLLQKGRMCSRFPRETRRLEGDNKHSWNKNKTPSFISRLIRVQSSSKLLYEALVFMTQSSSYTSSMNSVEIDSIIPTNGKSFELSWNHFGSIYGTMTLVLIEVSKLYFTVISPGSNCLDENLLLSAIISVTLLQSSRVFAIATEPDFAFSICRLIRKVFHNHNLL